LNRRQALTVLSALIGAVVGPTRNATPAISVGGQMLVEFRWPQKECDAHEKEEDAKGLRLTGCGNDYNKPPYMLLNLDALDYVEVNHRGKAKRIFMKDVFRAL